MAGIIWTFCIFTFVVVAVSAQTVRTKFSCEGRVSGYYADVTSGCQVYHMCDGLGRQFSYTCPNATLFQQRMLICDHWYMVNCSKSELDYGANLRIGQREMPFVDDEDPRTPRPDLQNIRPSQNEYDIIYRTGRAQFNNGINLVGADNDKNGGTDQYFLPSHWSTEYTVDKTTEKSVKIRSKGDRKPPAEGARVNFGSKFRATTPVYPKNVESNVKLSEGSDFLAPPGQAQPAAKVNYKSQFQATTPVYPKSVQSDVKSAEGSDFLAPPAQVQSAAKVNYESQFEATTPVYPKSVESIVKLSEGADLIQPPKTGTPLDGNVVQSESKVNFESHFLATTPVYPKSVENDVNLAEGADFIQPPKIDTPLDSIDVQTESQSNKVNYESQFKATTPVYPKSVESDVKLSEGADFLFPPSGTSHDRSVNFESDFQATTPVYPESVPADVKLSEGTDLLLPPILAQLSNEVSINFESKFKATTPVYPKSVDVASEEPSFLGILPPELTNQGLLDIKGNDVAPSKFYQPPKVRPDYTAAPSIQDWEELRKRLFIPDYEFPLETASRVSYDGSLSSFDV